MSSLVAAIDQGTSSSRVVIFDQSGRIVTSHQEEFPQYYPKPGWHEHHPKEILHSVQACMKEVAKKLAAKNIAIDQVKAIGITNQRETTVCWDAETGAPLSNAIVWDDMRTQSLVSKLAEKHPSRSRSCIQAECGLPLATYFSALKLKWLLENVTAVQEANNKETLRFGTVDSWLIYNLTGGAAGNGVHVTDVTNASRTMLMDIHTRQWSPDLLEFFEISHTVLPTIRSSSEVYGTVCQEFPFAGLPLSGCLGDQQAALVGQKCFGAGDVKNTYGTGCFMLYNTGITPVLSKNGLLTTVGYQLGKTAKTVYALEGSIAVAGSAIKWLRDNLNIIATSAQINELASKVPNNGGVYFVTAFSGLFAPYWRDDARGCIVGLTQFATKHHLARATLEATCFQAKAILDIMNQESGVPLTQLKVDGGMSNSDLCMQIQADLLGIPVHRPTMRESTALGAAFAAGLAVGVWKNLMELEIVNEVGKTVFSPKSSLEDRTARCSEWDKAVQRSLNWIVNETTVENVLPLEERSRESSTEKGKKERKVFFKLEVSKREIGLGFALVAGYYLIRHLMK